MFYVTRAIGRLAEAPYARFSAITAPWAMASAGRWASAPRPASGRSSHPGDCSLDLLSPVRIAVKHRLALTIVVLNDDRLGLPFFGTGRNGMPLAQATTHMPPWDFSRQGSPLVHTRRVRYEEELDGALAQAFSHPGCSIVDALIDPHVGPPVGARMDSVEALFQ